MTRPSPDSAPSRFDEAYFQRYYEDPATRVQGPEEVARLARAVCSFMAFWGMSLDSALDIGAGPGLWRSALATEAPGLKYRGVDVSPVACERYGHERRDISSWKARDRFDLVICQGVLQYLDDAQAERAIANLGAMTGGMLYLEALTRRDVREVVDLERSDTLVHLRTGAWYRKLLTPHFVTLGCGLFCSRSSHGVFFELEQAR